MEVAGVRLFNEGVSITQDAEEKIHQIVNAIKAISPSFDICIRLLKAGHTYEGLLWGKADDIPIGVYKKGISASQVLENMHKRVKKEYLKALKANRRKRFRGQVRTKPNWQRRPECAGDYYGQN